MAISPTYVFDDNGEVHAFVDGRHVASATDIDRLERWVNERIAAPPLPGPGGPPPGLPPSGPPTGPGGPMDDAPPDQGPDGPDGDKGIHVVFEGDLKPSPGPDAGPGPDVPPGPNLPDAGPDTVPGDNLPPRATHIITPNGLKGQILGKTRGLWSDQITIRLENGRIAKFDVTSDSNIEYVTEGKVSSPYARMQEILDADPDPTRTGLRRRIAELKVVKDEAKSSFRTASYVDESTLHNFIVEADAQIQEAIDAIEHMDQSIPYAPPEPQVFEQESMGGNDSSWLDETLNQMIEEAEATDFDQVIEEQPEVMVAELDTPALEHSEGVQEFALSYVRSKTAGLDPKAVSEYTAAFLARVEECRRVELTTRYENTPLEKEASTENFDGDAEGLFW